MSLLKFQLHDMQTSIIQQDHEDENNIDRQETCDGLNSQLKLKAVIKRRIDQYLKSASSKIN